MVMEMKQKKCQSGLLLILGCLMLSGCGMQEAPYELSEADKQLVVSYSAHVVSKFNTYQKDGLTYVPELKEELESEVPEQTPIEQEQNQTEANGNTTGTSNGLSEEPTGAVATFDFVFAETGLKFTYLGSEITDTYMADNTYAVNAGYQKTLLVLKMNVENPTEMPVTLDNLAAGNTFSVNYVMESGSKYNAKSVMTLLLNDFTTFEGTIESLSAMEMVIVFEIPKETSVVENMTVTIIKNGTNYQINL